MPRSSYSVLVNNYTLVGGATGGIEIDMSDYAKSQFFIKVTYATTSSTTGLSASGSDGVGPRSITYPTTYTGHPNLNPTKPIYYDSVGNILALNPILPSSTNVTAITKLNLDLSTVGNWYKFTFKNNDVSNAASVTIFGHVG